MLYFYTIILLYCYTTAKLRRRCRRGGACVAMTLLDLGAWSGDIDARSALALAALLDAVALWLRACGRSV